MKRFIRTSFVAAVLFAFVGVTAQTHIPNDSIFCRDPFITVDREAGCYYLIVSRSDGKDGKLFAYKSTDLKFWDAVDYVFRMPKNYPGTNDWWAPDTYYYKGAYYCFVTVSNFEKGVLRGTTILRSDSVTGPYSTYIPEGKMFITPQGVQCLDGSLYIDKDGTPWLTYCVEWNGPNVTDKVGEVWCMQLNETLSGAAGEPHRLFAASEAEWVKRVGEGAMVTDAPFLWRDKESGSLLMLWSSFAPQYAIGQAISRSGSILGPWEQQEQLIFKGNGGHQMVFVDLQGNLKISFHSPNERGSHLVIKDIRIKGGKFLAVD